MPATFLNFKDIESNMKLEIGGTVFIALALIWFLGVSGGASLDSVKQGLGSQLSAGGWIAFIVLIVLALFVVFSHRD